MMIVSTLLGGCGVVNASEGTTPASCVYVVGDGSAGDDAEVHYIVYPHDEKYTVGGGEDSWYVNCNARNFINNDGGYYHLNGERVGDYFHAYEAQTPTGVTFLVYGKLDWTLNENDAAMREFWTICLKYRCATGDFVDPNSQNFSSDGWNGFLGENFPPALMAATRIAANGVSDDIWSLESSAQIQILEKGISENFATQLRLGLGFQNDIVCGSNTSQWQDPAHPGNENGNVFNCNQVRFTITDIRLAPDDQQSPAGMAVLNTMRHTAAVAWYGENTDEVLGDVARIEACAQAGTYCSFTIVAPNAVTPTPENQ